jgi:ABC-type sugar transport system ATPase subunit
LQPILKLAGIGKSFGGVQALCDVSFELLRGEVHALVGENGAGKSTLVKIITGAHQPDAGTVEFAGGTVVNLDPQRARAMGIAAIYQQPALFPICRSLRTLGSAWSRRASGDGSTGRLFARGRRKYSKPWARTSIPTSKRAA